MCAILFLCHPYTEQVSGVKKCLRLILLVVAMETIKCTCVPSFTSMCATVSKFWSEEVILKKSA